MHCAGAQLPARACLARGYACALGMREARKEVSEVLRIEPTCTINGTSRRIMHCKNAKDAAHLSAGVRKAGLRKDSNPFVG